ncbi:glycosyltransferase family 4 protein [Candidatus Thiosymbion oneisti]|uniref:glycosyltransferase family 4 protein n=1 Tax=Candidatus Thiosymbion oneisti TaxID=589554 RepID=UPI00105F672F|nr:glycosyltransferase family 4 protein [Candidatus Thiosymbion oneisti]
MKIAILATASVTGEQGGAERFYPGLSNALIEAGANAEIVSIVSDERDFRHIQESYLRFYDLDLTGHDAVISTKAPGYVVRHPNHLCYLQHTMRVFYDLFNVTYPLPTRKHIRRRKFIHNLDTLALRSPRTRRIFTIGHEVSRRLKTFNGLDSEVLYQATTIKGFRQGDYRYVFLPGRLSRWKRGDLVIKAMRHVRSPVELLISGTGEKEVAWKSLASKNPRIRFLGRVSDEELLALYADALCVAFVPLHEDFGLITLEAFHSHKPVITCSDSGEPARIVEHGKSGFVCAPNPRRIAKHIDFLAADPAVSKRMGQRGAESIQGISWEHVATTLMDALEAGIERVKRPSIRRFPKHHTS